MANRKLGRPTDQRMALLRNQVTNLIGMAASRRPRPAPRKCAVPPSA